MEQNHSDKTPQTSTPEPAVVAETAHTTAAAQPAADLVAPVHTTNKKRNTIVALLITAMLLVGVVYVMEKQGRIDTNLFGGVNAMFKGNASVATVNGEKISQEQLDISTSQLEQAAAVQGVDITSPAAQAEIRTQALDVLVNTELLTQAAAERDITVSAEDVAARIAEIEIEVGGKEVLESRMSELGIGTEQLQSDVESEMIIALLLDVIFAEAAIEVTDEEVSEIYDAALASGADIPALEEVRPQVELQIRQSKEQEAVDTFLEEQKAAATVDISEA